MAGRRKQVQIQVRVTALEGTPAGEVINWLRDDPLPGLTVATVARRLLVWSQYRSVSAIRSAEINF